MTENLPWNRQDIFLDEIDEYPLYDYFPLTITADPQQDNTNSSQDTGVYF